jgi:hypothetical protein
MSDLEQRLTDHLRRRAAAATPRFDLDAVERGVRVVELRQLDRPRRRPRILAVVGIAAALVLLAIAVVAGSSRRDESTTVSQPDDVPAAQMTVIREIIDAINARDADAFIETFAPVGGFNPRGDFAESSSLFGHDLPVVDDALVRAWMSLVDAWGLEADLIACGPDESPAGGYRDDVDAFVRCEVTTRWHTLSMETTEGWGFELRGSELVWWNSFGQPELLDLNPSERDLPLGYDALEAWEAWLQANHAEDAARWLNARQEDVDCDGCAEAAAALAPDDPERAARLAPLLLWHAENHWAIDGHRFSPAGLTPYDPAFAHEIQASIQEYLDDDDGAPR